MSDRERWNEKHREVQVGGGTPREWLVEHEALIDELPKGRALDVACGRGREALWLAERGFTVDAVDVADVAVDAVRAAARERALPLQAWRVDLVETAGPFPREPYDIIVDFYFLERSLFPRMAAALAPGGLLVVETFTRDHVEVLGHDMPARFLLDHNELLTAFPGLRVVHYREAIIAGGDRGRAVASIVVRRT